MIVRVSAFGVEHEVSKGFRGALVGGGRRAMQGVRWMFRRGNPPMTSGTGVVRKPPSTAQANATTQVPSIPKTTGTPAPAPDNGMNRRNLLIGGGAAAGAVGIGAGGYALGSNRRP